MFAEYAGVVRHSQQGSLKEWRSSERKLL